MNLGKDLEEIIDITDEQISSTLLRQYPYPEKTSAFLDIAYEIRHLWPLPAIISGTYHIARHFDSFISTEIGSRFSPYINQESMALKDTAELISPYFDMLLSIGIPLVIGHACYNAINSAHPARGKQPHMIRPTPKKTDLALCARDVFQSRGDKDTLFRAIYTATDASISSGKKKRRIFSEIHSQEISGKKDRLRASKEPLHQLALTYLDFATNQYSDAIERIDRLTKNRRQEIGKDRIDDPDYNKILSKILTGIALDSRIQGKRAFRRAQWFATQMYLDAAADPGTVWERLGDSKHEVRIVASGKVPEDLIIKHYRGNNKEASQAGEIRFTKQIGKIISGEKAVPQLFQAFRLNKETNISLYTLLQGKTLHEFIRDEGHSSPRVLRTAESAMDYMGLIYAKIPPETNQLRPRDHKHYILSNIQLALGRESKHILSGLNIYRILAPIFDSENRGRQVTSKDPHAGNWGSLEDGRIASYDNELTHSISIAGEIAKFFLFSFDPDYDSKPGQYDDPKYGGYVTTIIDAYNSRAESQVRYDEQLFIDIKNFEILQGISLYSPYTLRTSMREKKKDILYKAKSSIDIICSYFPGYHRLFKESYSQMGILIDRFIIRNGF